MGSTVLMRLKLQIEMGSHKKARKKKRKKITNRSITICCRSDFFLLRGNQSDIQQDRPGGADLLLYRVENLKKARHGCFVSFRPW